MGFSTEKRIDKAGLKSLLEAGKQRARPATLNHKAPLFAPWKVNRLIYH
jgi:hypothetical protein